MEKTLKLIIVSITIIAASFCNLVFSQTNLYKASYSIEQEMAQDQFYVVNQENNTWKVQERGIFLSNPDIYAFSEAMIDSTGYVYVEVFFNNGNIKSYTKVERVDDALYYSYLNGNLVDSIVLDTSNLYLFDGPNPSYDCLNSTFLKDHSSKNITLILLNWINGTLTTEKAYYIKNANQVAVIKKETNRIAFFHFKDNGILPAEYNQDKESYSFKVIDKLPSSINEFKIKKW